MSLWGMSRPVRGASRAAACAALVAVGCGGRTSGTNPSAASGSDVLGTSGAVTGSMLGGGDVVSGGSGAASGVASDASGGVTGNCDNGCTSGASGSVSGIGSACVTDSDCSAPGALACAFEVAAGCSAKGTCQAIVPQGDCAYENVCTCSGATVPNPACGLGYGYAYEPIAYEGFCTDGGTVAGDAGADAGSPPSCAPGGPGMTNCGPGGIGTESCCTSLEVTGGTFYRTYASDADGGAVGLADPATVSAFRLDKYLVTVGRFRQFVSAVLPPVSGTGWLPAAGSGKHTHLNAGRGLLNVGIPADAGVVYEPGWVATDDVNIAPTDVNLSCDADTATWIASAGRNETLPINCVSWYDAYAFCIWDGGFLPSEAEWAYAAAGGNQQREYPWGSTDPGSANQYAIYDCYYPSGKGGLFSCSTQGPSIAQVGSATLGAGLWGQLDLAGNVTEWDLDWYGVYVDPCTDCADLTEAFFDERIVRGGAFDVTTSYLLPGATGPTFRNGQLPLARSASFGFRCARIP